ncbi:MaoC family dehydratase [Paucibacter sp. AS339]|uniref:MaoC family dehydratase n=1 Tax=Paucibacter hankyongi TaxID=3133434 RepID=UPI0030955C75
MRVFDRLASLAEWVGRDIGCSEWILVDQARIQRFADATADQQWIHTDPQRAAKGPFAGTIAHGFLTLSLLPHFFETGFRVEDSRMGLNYGLGKVRFPAPVPVDSRLRGHFNLQAFDLIEGGAQLNIAVTVELEGSAKPACVAEALIRQYV